MTRSEWSLKASAGAARMHIGPLSWRNMESGDVFFRNVQCAQFNARRTGGYKEFTCGSQCKDCTVCAVKEAGQIRL